MLRKTQYPALAGVVLAMCSVFLSCSNDSVAPRSRLTPAEGASYETADGPESQSEANDCTHGTATASVLTSKIHIVTTSSCNRLTPTALGSDVTPES